MPATGASIKFYQNIDTYLQGGDAGPGFTRTSPWNTTGIPDIVGVTKNAQFEALWHEPSSGTPLWDRYFSANYSQPQSLICNSTTTTTNPCVTGTGNLNNNIDTNANTDNGMAAQWNVPAGATSHSVEYRITFATGAVDLTKAFAPQTIVAGGTSTLTFTLTNRTTGAVASINFLDTLPTGVRVAAVPNIRTSCPAGTTLGTTFPAGMTVTAAAGGGIIQVAGARIDGAAVGGTRACQIAVDVTSTTAGSHVNGNGNITGINNLVNLVGDETLTVIQPQLTAGKSVVGTLIAGQTGATADGHYLVTVQNTGTAPTSGAITIADTLPAGVSAVSAASAAGTVSCGTLPASGTVTCTLTPATPIVVGATATVRINVAIAAGTSGSATNTVAVAGGGDPDPLPTCPSAGNAQCAQATSTIAAPPSVAKVFSPTTIVPGGSSTLTITLTNPNAAAATLAANLVDSLPAGLTLTAAPTTTCTGTVSGTVGGSTITLGSGASIPGGMPGSCTITASVTGSSPGSYLNSIPAGALVTNLGNSAAAATATLTIAANAPTLAKAFAPATITSGGTSALTLTLGNANATAVVLTANLVDNLPTGMTLAAAPTTTCMGTVTGMVGGSTITLGSGASIPAGSPGTCTITASVTSSTPGSATNTIPAGGLVTNFGSNAAAATATLTVNAAVPTLTKAFAPATITSGGTSTLTLTLGNANATAAVLGANLVDTLPAGMTLTAAPTTTCTGTVTGTVGGSTITLGSGASIPAGSPGTCTITASVTSSTPGSATNTIPAGGLATNFGSNAAAATATLTVNAGAPTLAKNFAPAAINAGNTSTLTITLRNANATAAVLSANLVDNLPAGMTLAAAPTTTCTGTVSGVIGGNTVTLASGATIPAGSPGQCTITAVVTSDTPGIAVNTLPIGALVTTNGSNAAAASANLDVGYAFCPASGAAPVLSIVNGINLSQYFPGDASDSIVPALAFTLGGDVNALMVDIVRNRALFIQRVGTTSTLYAYDRANGGWYQAAPSFVTAFDFPRAGMNAEGVGYLVSGEASPSVWTVTANPAPGSFNYTVANLGSLTYQPAPSNLTSGDIAFDIDGTGWLAAGRDLYTVDMTTLVATRQTRPTFGGQPSTTQWAGIAFGSDGQLYVADNTATSSYYAYDPATGELTLAAPTVANSSRDLASCVLPIPGEAILSANKSLAQVNGVAYAGGSVYPGDVLSYDITVENTGVVVATIYPGDIVETLPANTTFEPAGNDFTCVGASCTNNDAFNVAAGGSVTVQFVVTVDDPLPAGVASITNAVTVEGVDCGAPGSDCETTTPVGPVLSVSKSADPDDGEQVIAGDVITYTVSVVVGNGAITADVVVTDTLGAGLTFGSVIDAGAFTCVGTLVCTLPSGTSPGVYDVVYTATVDAGAGGTNASNSVTATGGGGQPPVCTDCSTTHPVGTPSLSIAKVLSDAPDPIVLGSVLEYTVTATNDGDVTLTNVVVTDNLITPATITCPSVAPNGTCELVGTYTVTQADVDAGQVVNNASADSNESDPDTIEITTPIDQNPSLSIAKVLSDAPDPIVLGSVLEYTITATNDGDVTLTNVVVTDNLITPATITCPSVAPNGTCVLVGSYTVDQDDVDAGQVVNSATADSNESDPDTIEITTPIPRADLRMAKSVDELAPVIGDTVTFTLTVTNDGPDAATGVIATDVIPDGYAYVSDDGAGAYVPATGVWTIGVLANGASVSLQITATVLAEGDYVNVASVEADQVDPDTGNNEGEASTTPLTPFDISVAKTVTDANGDGIAQPGETLTYAITLSNSGTQPAADIDIRDVLDSQTVFVSADNGGVHVAGTIDWIGLTVPGSDGIDPGRRVLTVMVTVVDPIPAGVTQIGNVAFEAGDTPPNCTATPQPANCASLPTAADVTLAKTVSDGNGDGVAQPGEALTYTITLINNGGTDATGFGITDNLDDNTVFVSADNGGTHAAGVITWGGLTVPAHDGVMPGSLVLTVNVTVVDPIPAGATGIVNVAFETGGTPPDCDATPRPANCASLPTEGIVAIAKSVSDGNGNGMADPGETLTYTITLTNNGGSDVTGFGVTDNLDVNTVFVSADNGGTHAGGLVTWTGLTVPAHDGVTPGTVVLTVMVTVIDPIPAAVTLISNIAYETGTTPPNCSATPRPANCASLPTRGELLLSKALTDESGAVDGRAEPGEQLTYSITLTNTGGSAVTGYGVTDDLDVNTVFVSADNGGSHDGSATGGAVDWTGLSVAPGGSLVLTVVAAVVDPIPEGVTAIVNVAYGDGMVPPDCAATPAAAGCASIPTIAQLAVSKALSGESIEPDGLAEPGEQLTYTITLTNEGGTPALATLVNETVPQHTRFVSGTPTWTCLPGDPAGTACDALIDVPAADGAGAPGVATLLFTVEVDDPLADDAQSIANAVAINDGTPPDCAALPGDPACVVLPTVNVDLTKSVVGLTPTGPSTYVVTYLIEIDNLGGAPAQYTLADTLDTTAQGVVFTGAGRVTTTGGALNPALVGGQFAPVNGSSVQLSAMSVTLAAGATHAYTVTVPIGIQPGSLQNGECTGEPGHGLYNRANITGSFERESAACAAVSGEVPLIRLIKTVALGVDQNGNHYGDVGDVLHYRFTISNPGSLPLSAVQLIDPRVGDLQCDPTTASGVPFYVFRGDELFDDAFEGRPRGGILVPGDSVACTATYALTAEDVARRRVVNTASATGTGPGGQAVSSTSTAIFTSFR